MTSRADKVKELFQQALDLPEGDRSGFLATACDGDEELRHEVQDLLRALAQAGDFLADGDRAPTEGPGSVIGRYRLLEPMGEGGFGLVFRAEQIEPMRREVALKVIKLGMDTRRVVARFELERQALARMNHPNIAAVFDGGCTPAGRPYFVMELVAGEPITAFCNRHGLGIEERVALLRQVCNAVQHAHHKGVVHRDLKPGNVLVVLDADGAPQSKVIDFGIAKAMDPDQGGMDTPTLTAQGGPVGTLEYMAPEQTSGGEVDSRADVYGLGVLLCELVTGRRPFERDDAGGQGTAAVLERIRSATPPRPSSLARAAGRLPLPGADALRWARRLRGDLDWIVLRALQKEPARRYPTPSALADDLQRYLDGRPVEAGPPTVTYRVRRFVGRYRLAVAAAGAAMIALLGGFAVVSAALADARVEAARSERTLTSMKRLLLSADPFRQKGRDYTVRQMLDDFAGEMGAVFEHDPAVASELYLTVGGSYRSLGQLAEAERLVGRGLELARSTDSVDRETRLQLLMEWAWVQRELGRAAAAEAAVEEVLGELQPAGAELVAYVRALLAKADLRRLQGDAGAVEPLAQRGLELLAGASPGQDVPTYRAIALDLLGLAADGRGELVRAREHFQQALELRRQALGADHVQLATSWTNLADLHKSMQDFAAAETAANEALRVQRLALGEVHPAVAQTLSLLGDVALRTDRLDAAERLYDRAQEIRRQTLPADHLDHAVGCAERAQLALARQRNDEAEALLREALAIRAAVGAPETFSHAAALQNLGVALSALGRHAEALDCYLQAHALHLRVGGEGSPPVADCLQNVGLMHEALGRPLQAVACHRQALALRQRHRPDDLRGQIASLVGIASAAAAAGDLAVAARADADRADLLASIPDEHPQRVAATRLKAARRFLDAGDAMAATPLAETVLAFCAAELSGEWPHGECSSLLAECRLAAGALDEALRLARDGVAMLADSPAPADRKERARQVLQRVQAAVSDAAATGGR